MSDSSPRALCELLLLLQLKAPLPALLLWFLLLLLLLLLRLLLLLLLPGCLAAWLLGCFAAVAGALEMRQSMNHHGKVA